MHNFANLSMASRDGLYCIQSISSNDSQAYSTHFIDFCGKDNPFEVLVYQRYSVFLQED